MKLHFNANQEYQKKAVKSIVDLFKGQTLPDTSSLSDHNPPQNRQDAPG